MQIQKKEAGQLKAEQLKAEFDLKSRYLRDFCIANDGTAYVSPLDYYYDLYNNDEEFLNGDKEGVPFCYKYGDGIKVAPGGIEDVLQTAVFGENRTKVAVFPASYFHWPAQKNLENFYAIVIDLDGVSAADLYCLLKLEMKRLLPTYIVNSGGGVHLVYIFEEPIVAYKFRHQTIKQMIREVGNYFRKARYGYRIDPNSSSLVHPYRVIGSETKLGQTCAVFKVGEKWSVKKMLKKLGIKTDVFKDKAARKQAQEEKKTSADKKDRVVKMPTGHKNFYNFFALQMTNVQEGHRYNALFALAIVAYKCRVKREEVESLIAALIDVYNQREHKEIVKEYELKKAMYGYSLNYVGVSSKQLEEWTGIPFPHTGVKRRPKGQRLKRDEHLKVARAVKNAKETATREAIMRRYLEANPSASLTELMDELGWTKKTVVKYRKMVRG